MRGYAAKNALRLHTPGHKGSLCDIDVTELSDGSFPADEIASVQKTAAELYGAKHCVLLCCGSSQGVKSAIYHAACNGIADVNSHRSVFDGFKLSAKKCVTVRRRGVRPITVEDIKGALTSDIGAVVVTSPTYYGYCADIDGIARFCRSNGLLFIVDGAHGAHFGANKHLPPSFAGDCDICNLSAHKTLDALTQSAMLFSNLPDAEHKKLVEVTELMGTTSPSYLLYASLEHAIRSLKRTGGAYEALFDPISEVKRRYGFEENDDFTRLVLDCRKLCKDSSELNAALMRNGVASELDDGERLVFIFTAADTPQSVQRFDCALGRALKEII